MLSVEKIVWGIVPGGGSEVSDFVERPGNPIETPIPLVDDDFVVVGGVIMMFDHEAHGSVTIFIPVNLGWFTPTVRRESMSSREIDYMKDIPV
jgi:hypothetical protein